MKLTRHVHQQIRLKNRLLTLIFLCALGAAAWFSTRFSYQVDWTNTGSNTLSTATQKLLRAMPGKVDITAYIKSGLPIRLQIAHLIDRYSYLKPDLRLDFIDPNYSPQKARELNIGEEGLVVVEYQGRSEKLTFIDEATLTNALLQLTHAEDRWVSFLTGHGERSPEGEANFDLNRFGKELVRRRINAQTINLAKLPAIPNNSALLVIASPTIALLPGEIEIVKQYIQRGGNLLLLNDPNDQVLNFIWPMLGIHPLPGQIVDKASKQAGIDDPSFVIVSEYSPHPVTRNFQALTVYPAATGFGIDEDIDYENVPLLSSGAESWTETGPLTGTIRFESDGAEKQGPITMAYALTRNLHDGNQQRIIVVGDGDFLANSYIGNAGNLEMGLRMVNWLIHDDRFIDIPAKTAPDRTLKLTTTSIAMIGFGFLIVLPLCLLGTGFWVWRRRRRR
ncbi:MAG: GldG family protein [Methylococcaceae bacterium]|nr:GldG family protein [Methylococcaceae bacterium]